MSKTFRVHTPDQMLLLPPSLKDWLPANHLVYFIHDVVEGLDIREIDLSYQSLRGYPPHEPRLMLRILFYAYCTGVYSSRQIARRLQEDVAFRVLAGNSQPDFRTICKFRKRHEASIKGLFLQILKRCAIAGLVRCGHVTLDGTKLKASASKHKAMSYGRMVEEEQRLQQEIDAMLAQAERTDKAERNLKGDDLPTGLAFREKRLAKIREAKAALEKAIRERDAVPEPAEAGAPGPEEPDDPPRGGKKRKRQPGQPEPQSQRNFTDLRRKPGLRGHAPRLGFRLGRGHGRKTCVEGYGYHADQSYRLPSVSKSMVRGGPVTSSSARPTMQGRRDSETMIS